MQKIPPAICIPHLEVPSFCVGPVPVTERANDRSISHQFWLCCSSTNGVSLQPGSVHSTFGRLQANVIQIGQCFWFRAVAAVTPLWVPECCNPPTTSPNPRDDALMLCSARMNTVRTKAWCLWATLRASEKLFI